MSLVKSEHQVRNVTIARETQTTAAAVNIYIGFVPRHVIVSNATDRVKLEWNENMADAEAIKTVAAGTRTRITTLGITPLSDSSGHGFTIGLDTDLMPNDITKELDIIAFG